MRHSARSAPASNRVKRDRVDFSSRIMRASKGQWWMIADSTSRNPSTANSPSRARPFPLCRRTARFWTAWDSGSQRIVGLLSILAPYHSPACRARVFARAKGLVNFAPTRMMGIRAGPERDFPLFRVPGYSILTIWIRSAKYSPSTARRLDCCCWSA